MGLAKEAFNLITSGFSLNFFGVGHAVGEILEEVVKDFSYSVTNSEEV